MRNNDYGARIVHVCVYETDYPYMSIPLIYVSEAPEPCTWGLRRGSRFCFDIHEARSDM